MSLEIQQRPATWAACGIPLVYKFQRQDAQWASVANNGGLAEFTFVLTNLTAFFPVGATVHVKGGAGVYDNITTVAAVSFAAGDTKVKVNVAYVAAAGGTTNDFMNSITLRPSYRAVIDLYDAATNAALFNFSLQITPTVKGVVLADVSTIKALLSPEIAPLVAHTPTQDVSKTKKFYIKYTEVWTGSANGAVSDVANPRNAVLGAFQVKQNNDYGANAADGFLTLFSAPRLFQGKYFEFSYYNRNAYCYLMRYKGTAAIGMDTMAINQELCRARVTTTSEDRIETVFASTQQVILAPNTSWVDVVNVWNKTATNMDNSQFSASVEQALLAEDGAIVAVTLNVNISGVFTGGVDVGIVLVDAFGANKCAPTNIVRVTAPLAAADFRVVLKVENAATGYSANPVAKLRIYRDNFPGTTGNPLVLITPYVGQRVSYDPASVVSRKSMTVEPALDPTVTLGWMNSRGGVEWWTFHSNHEESFVHEDGRKVRRQVLFARNLTYNEWDTLNGLNTLGEFYQQTPSEITSSLNTLKKRRGQQAYVYDDVAGTFTGVLVIPTENKTNTRQVKHTLTITIEYPETLLP